MIKIKRLILAALLVFGCMTVTGCDAFSGRNKTINEIELDGFASMLTEYNTAATRHQVDEVTKIVYIEHGHTTVYRQAAIDLFNKRIYINPSMSQTMDDNEPNKSLSDAEVKEARSILDQNGVLEWENEYGSLLDLDKKDIVFVSVGWSLYLQYSDNTVDRFIGYGTCIPDTYETFVEEILAFANAKR